MIFALGELWELDVEKKKRRRKEYGDGEEIQAK